MSYETWRNCMSAEVVGEQSRGIGGGEIPAPNNAAAIDEQQLVEAVIRALKENKQGCAGRLRAVLGIPW